MNDRDFKHKQPECGGWQFLSIPDQTVMLNRLQNFRDAVIRLDNAKAWITSEISHVYGLHLEQAKQIVETGDFGRYWLADLKGEPQTEFKDLNHRLGHFHQLIMDDIVALGLVVPERYRRPEKPVDEADVLCDQLEQVKQKAEAEERVVVILHGNSPGLAQALIMSGIVDKVTEPDGCEVKADFADRPEAEQIGINDVLAMMDICNGKADPSLHVEDEMDLKAMSHHDPAEPRTQVTLNITMSHDDDGADVIQHLAHILRHAAKEART